ncbi:MAG: bifunctional (p)ppGpp synthetase/guanosine-3',5'-bis(diphosphate) 3'-pyrophosphohydrolase, partial [Candidatus Neomarinimicrobiota bacterium]|nr:bifunctional (p)ppGpp synthetase/guanosine-3',5'-bis(diphosphate) 3'-pyrophosphohydrolase [Candidatus Neomarinimicrobiota bacterium]
MANPISKLVPFIGGEFPTSFKKLLGALSHYNFEKDEHLKVELWKAYEFGLKRHEGQKRLSGEPYFESHCVEVAMILASWNMDITTIISGMLHDTVEDTKTTLEEIQSEFGENVADLVDGVSKLSGIHFSTRKAQQAGNFMKMLISVAKDLRVIIIKFADRLHNMKTIKYMSRIKQHRIAVETRDVYAPLAHRLGMASVKWRLDDLALQVINPDAYKDIDKKLKSSNKERDKYIKTVTSALNDELSKNKLSPTVYGRSKSHSSIYGKMIQREKSFEEIHDILAVRVVVTKIEECYLALGVLHQKFKPIQERFKDFIAMPKSNGYQSIHTTIVGPEGKMIEIQIRTEEMEKTAEIGVAAHWRYKEGKNSNTNIDSHVEWLRDLLEMLQSEENDPKEFMNLLKIDLFGDEIFVFTPNGDLLQLPAHSTPVDFAYSVHTEIGQSCLGAKVNNMVAPLNTKLKNGDKVEIITSASQRPNYGWLEFTVTSKARNKIKNYLHKKEREESVKIGEQLFSKSLRRLKLTKEADNLKNTFSEFGLNSVDHLFESIGKGEISVRDLIDKSTIKNDRPDVEESPSLFSFKKIESKSIKLEGIKNVMANFGKCCNPIPGDSMVGFVTRGRGLTVHRANCYNLPISNKESDRLVPVEWEVSRSDLFNVHLKIVGQDRKGLLKDMTE